jgi:hypothetical protein
VLYNLKAEMARKGLTSHEIAAAIGKVERSARDKINCLRAFDFNETILIRDRFFPGMDLEYLFAGNATTEAYINNKGDEHENCEREAGK